jgi:peptide/nickel transport system permease protein
MVMPPNPSVTEMVSPPEPDGSLSTAEATELGLAAASKPRSMFRRGWEVFAENRLALISLGFMIFIVLFCFLGPVFYHTNQVNTNLADYLCHPGSKHLLGCNDVGYDQLGRLMVGGQVSLEVGFAAAIVSVLIGAIYGAVSGFVGGVVDSFLMRLVDAGLSLPYIMVIIILSVVFHPNTIIMICAPGSTCRRSRWPAAAADGLCSGTSCRTRSARSSCRPRSRSPTRS